MTSTWWTKPRGGAGWLATAGMAAGIATWWPLAVAAGGGWVALAMRGYRRSARATLHLRDAFPDAERSLTHVRGAIDGMPFVVRNSIDTMHVLVGTPLPAGITLARDSGEMFAHPTFPFGIYTTDSESELAWRLLLTAGVRAELCALFGSIDVTLRDGWFDIVVDDHDADGPTIERWIRDGIALVEQIPREPEPSVRFSHYVWLVHGGYEVPALLHQAANDPDPEIREWARDQRPTETLYR